MTTPSYSTILVPTRPSIYHHHSPPARAQHTALQSTDRLSVVIMHMLDDGHYIDPAWLSKSGTDFYVDEFESSCKLGKLTYSGICHIWSQVLWKPSRY